jgi:outer membrane protein assembly factor BamB/cell division septation protein DedD
MIGAIRCGVTAIMVGALGLSAAGAQPRRTPSILLPLEILWTGGLPAAPAWAPVEATGRLCAALQDGRLVAVNLADGEVLWTVEQLAVAQPAIGERLLFVAGEDELVALEIATGDQVWSMPLEAPLSAPLVWNRHWLIATLDGGQVLALRGDDGATFWRRTLEAAIEVPPSLAGDRVYVSVTDGRVAALSLLDGTTLWEQQLEGAPQQVLPLDDLFVGAGDNNFYRLSRVDGAEQWRWPTGGDIVGAPAVDEERVFFSSRDNVVWALDRASGVQQWRQPLTARPTAGPSYVGDLLVFGGLSQEITFYDPSDGTLYGRLRVPTDLAFPPMHLTDPRDPTLVFVTGDGRLTALGPPTVPRLLDPGTTAILGKAPVEEALADGLLGGDTEPETAPDTTETPEAAVPVNDAVAALSPVPPLVAEPADLLTSATPPALGPLSAALEPGVAVPTAPPEPASAAELVAAVPAPPNTPGTTGPPIVAPTAVLDRTPPTSASVGGEFAIQVGAFASEGDATAVSDRLAAADYPVYVLVPLPGDARPLYRVRIGDFPDRGSANAAGAQITRDQELDWHLVALP